MKSKVTKNCSVLLKQLSLRVSDCTKMSEVKNIEEMSKDALVQHIHELKAVLSRAKIIKEDSDFFKSNKNDDAIKYRNLSETKKYLESKHSDILDTMKQNNNNKMMTSDEFHKALVILMSTE